MLYAPTAVAASASWASVLTTILPSGPRVRIFTGLPLNSVSPNCLRKVGIGALVAGDCHQPQIVSRRPLVGPEPHLLVEVLRQRLVDGSRNARPQGHTDRDQDDAILGVALWQRRVRQAELARHGRRKRRPLEGVNLEGAEVGIAHEHCHDLGKCPREVCLRGLPRVAGSGLRRSCVRLAHSIPSHDRHHVAQCCLLNLPVSPTHSLAYTKSKLPVVAVALAVKVPISASARPPTSRRLRLESTATALKLLASVSLTTSNASSPLAAVITNSVLNAAETSPPLPRSAAVTTFAARASQEQCFDVAVALPEQ